MHLTLKEANGVLQSEINWCLDNPDKELTHEQQMGFVNGLKQAQLLLEKAEEKKIGSFTSITDFLLRF